MHTFFLIVPVFNTAQWLDRCVQSALQQSGADARMKVVLVDDGSTDESGALCDKWCKRDSRVFAIHRENGGLGPARNTGIEFALSTDPDGFISFLDSDDWLDSRYLTWTQRAILRSKSDICVCPYWRPDSFHSSNHPNEISGRDSFPFKVMSLDEFYGWCLHRETEGLFLSTIAPAKTYRLALWKSVRFPETKNPHEDMFTVYKILSSVSKISLIETPLYAYFVNPNSLTGGGYRWTPGRMYAVLAGREQVRHFAIRGLKLALEACLTWHFNRILWNLTASEAIHGTRKFRKRLRRMLREDWTRYHDCLPDEVRKKRWKIAIAMHPAAWAIYRLTKRLNRHFSLKARHTSSPNQSALEGKTPKR